MGVCFLINRVNNIEVFNQILWPKINEMGFIDAFEDTFNMTYDSLNEEFKVFLNLPLEEQLEIIPDISFLIDKSISSTLSMGISSRSTIFFQPSLKLIF